MSHEMVVTRQRELRDAVAAARARVGVLEAEQRRARRSGQRALDELRAFCEDVEAGRRPADPDEEQRLVAAATSASATLRVTPVMSHGQISDVEVVDEIVEGKLAGARQALEDAETELQAFERAQVWALVAAQVPAATAAHEQLLTALQAVEDALGDWSRVASEVTGLGARTGVYAVDDVPQAPIDRHAEIEIARVVRDVRAGRPPAPPIPRHQDQEADRAA